MAKKEFTATQVGAMIEQFQAQFKVFGEGLDAIRQKTDKIDGMMEMIAQNTEDITMMKIIAKALGRDVKSLNRKIDKLTGEVTDIKKELRRKADREELLVLEKRLTS